ncbi:hypothetical protein [Mycobacterium asiaticum]|nr:hypothetical protein [Mycobacterium asiaticum]
MDIPYLLTATRSARKSLDLDARRLPVDEVIAVDHWSGPPG